MITLTTTVDENEDIYRLVGVPEGFQVTPRKTSDGYDYSEYRWPELGPARLFDHLPQKGVVIPILNWRYRVRIDLDDDPDEIPESVTVSFERTTDPETPFETYDITAMNQKYLEHLREEVVHVEGLLGNDPDDDRMYRSELENYRLKIARIEAGETLVSHHSYAQFFGQPVFIQNPVFPQHDGRSAFHLVTLETGWGGLRQR